MARLPLLPGRGPGPVPLTGLLVEKCGIVVTGVAVVVVAVLLFRVPRSLPGIGKFAVFTDAASDVRRSWWISGGKCAGTPCIAWAGKLIVRE